MFFFLTLMNELVNFTILFHYIKVIVYQYRAFFCASKDNTDNIDFVKANSVLVNSILMFK